MKVSIVRANLLFEKIEDMKPGDVFFPGIGNVTYLRTDATRRVEDRYQIAVVDPSNGNLQWLDSQERFEVSLSATVHVLRALTPEGRPYPDPES